MPALLIKDLPPNVHAWLKQEAAEHRRSMTQQAIVVFEERMNTSKALRFPAPLKLKKPVSNAFLLQARKEGRP